MAPTLDSENYAIIETTPVNEVNITPNDDMDSRDVGEDDVGELGHPWLGVLASARGMDRASSVCARPAKP
jgi:hypothetical protein